MYAWQYIIALTLLKNSYNFNSNSLTFKIIVLGEVKLVCVQTRFFSYGNVVWTYSCIGLTLIPYRNS